MSNAPWLEEAKKHIGVQEVRGKGDNPQIIKWFKYSGLPKSYWHDSTAWCSVFVCAMTEITGYKSTRNAMARSWMRAGTKCKPQPGAIAVFPRGRPPSGHVGIVESVEGSVVNLIDGNVRNKVKRSTREVKDALGFRWPQSRALPHKEVVKEVIKETVKTTAKATKTAVKSKSVWAQLAAVFWIVFGYLTDGLQRLFGWAQGVVETIPVIGSEVSSTLSSSEEMARWLNIPWQSVSLGLVVVLMVIVGGRHVRDKMKWGQE